MLHRIENKFNQWMDTPPQLGPFVEQSPSLNSKEQEMRKMILQSSMPEQRARVRLANLRDHEPYTAFLDYISDMAALSAVYKKEVTVSYLGKGKKKL